MGNSGEKPKILLIDDTEAFRLCTSCFLEDNSFDVICAENGRDGLEKYHSIKPDIVLVDMEMPILGGIGFITEVRKEDVETPIIVISGVMVAEKIVSALIAGAWDYLIKPIFDMRLLKAAVDRAFTKVLLTQERKMHEEKLRVEAEEKGKIEVVQAMMVSLNHEIRNPLTIISARVHGLKKKCRESDLKALEDTEKAVDRIAGLLHKIYDLEKIELEDYAGEPGSKLISV